MDKFRVNKHQLYERNVATVKQYGDEYKVSQIRVIRKGGYEESGEKRLTTHHEEKMTQSLSRTRSRVFELAKCNKWQYFCTFTIRTEGFDRYNLDDIYKRQFAPWLKNYNARRGTKIQYMIIPEQHKDGAWHFHGLLQGLPKAHLELFKITDKLPMRLLTLLKDGREIFNWNAYLEKFGFVTLERVRSQDAICKYITKYITKDLNTSERLSRHLYYASHGLNRATEIYRGEIQQEFEPDYYNDYVRVKWFGNIEEAISLFANEV